MIDEHELRSWISQTRAKADRQVQTPEVQGVLAVLTALEARFLPPEVGPYGNSAQRAARRTDPDTSKLAASIEAGDFDSTLRVKVLREFGYTRVLTDDDLRDALTARHNVEYEKSSVTKRRGELVDMGVVEDSGVRVPSDYGRDMIVWRLTPEWMKRVQPNLPRQA